MVNALIETLKKGTIETVLLFGDTDEPQVPPYVVVKPESGAIAGTRQFRIIVHHRIGMFDDLQKYVFKELNELLIYSKEKGGKVFIADEEGNEFRLQPGGYTDVMTETSEIPTLVMERLFIQPFINGGSR